MLLAARIALILAGLIHLLPLPGLLGAERLQALYGVPVDAPDLLILLRHRALLFGMLGAYLIAAAWLPSLRASAFVLGLISVTGFLALAWTAPGLGAGVQRIVFADIMALILLLAGGIALLLAPLPPTLETA